MGGVGVGVCVDLLHTVGGGEGGGGMEGVVSVSLLHAGCGGVSVSLLHAGWGCVGVWGCLCGGLSVYLLHAGRRANLLHGARAWKALRRGGV